jgi:hypothetical protein
MATRVGLGMGVALLLGLSCLPLGCEGWDAPTILSTHTLPNQAPRGVDLPAEVVQQMTACAERIRERGDPSKPLVHAMQFQVEATEDGHVVAAGLEDTSIRDVALASCIERALRTMTVPMGKLPLRVASSGPRRALGAEARALVGFPLASLLAAAFNPAVIVVTGLMLTVVVVVYLTGGVHPGHLLGPTAVSMPTATAVPTTTAVPKPRRHPNQTCENDELDALEAEKKRLCGKKYAADCSGNRLKSATVADRMDNTPCSAIQRSIGERMLCLKQRNRIEDECYGGIPDAGHAEQIRNTERGIDLCVALQAINCAAGHPMLHL